MRILFAGKQHYDPGGISASTDQLGHRLAAAGHEVAVVAHAPFDRPPPPSEVDRTAVVREASRGYEAFSVDLLPPSVALDIVARRFHPDVIVVNAGGRWWHDWTAPLVRSAPTEIPLILYIRDSDAIELLDQRVPRIELVIANAEHLARAAARRGISAIVVPSLIEAERYRVQPTGEAVVFINPVASKGVETALALAECRPDVPFEFRESWHLSKRVGAELADRIRTLENVVLLPSSTDAAEPYRRARLLLVPYEDMGRPRVVPEAHVSGIPVLARDDPALREAVGPGGVLVAPGAAISAWLDGLSELWDDADAHARYADAARDHSRRQELDAGRITARFIEALSRLVGRPGHGPRRPLLTGLPTASVILPVRDEADTIDAQLAALAGQDYCGAWEVVVADNGSTDATRQRAEAWRMRLPALTIVDASGRRGVAHARNVGLRAARGELLLICDGDDIVADGWLSSIVRSLDDHPIVTGRVDLRAMNGEQQYGWTGDADAMHVPVGYGFLPYAHGGNLGMWRDILDVLGGFDELLLRAEDIDFSWRAGYLGIAVHFEPGAVLYHRMRTTARSVFRSAVPGGISEPGLYRRHRDRGMPRTARVDVVAHYRFLWRELPGVLAGRSDRHRWAHHAGKRLGRVLGSLRYRTVYL